MQVDASVVAFATALVAALSACTAYNPQLSATPFYCGSSEPRCPDGYTCQAPGDGSAVCSTVDAMPSAQCAMTGHGVLAAWDLTGQPGTQTSSAASMTLPGVTTLPLARSPALMSSPGQNSISASNWPSAAQPDRGSYFTLSISAPAGCTLSLSAIALDVSSSGTGPASAALATSQDGFAHDVPVSTSAPGDVPLAVSGAPGMIELRIFGYAASGSAGTMRVQNQVSITGEVQ